MSSSTGSSRLYLRWLAAVAVAATVALAALPDLVLRARMRARADANPDAVWVFGDSRLVLAVDLEELERGWRRPIVPHARGGMGVYDFLVFVEAVPDGATVIVAPSVPLFTRDEQYNRSGLLWSALWRVGACGYPVSELAGIYANNHYRVALPEPDSPRALIDADAPVLDRLDDARRQLHAPEARYRRRWLAFWDGIDDLVARGCDVKLVELPVSDALRRAQADSPRAEFTDRLRAAAAARGLDAWVDLQLPTRDNVMYDIDHLNRRGRTLLTELMLQRWQLAR